MKIKFVLLIVIITTGIVVASNFSNTENTDITASAQSGATCAPVDFMLVLDRSASMSGDKIAGARAAALEFVNTVQNGFADIPEDPSRIGLVSFGQSLTASLYGFQTPATANDDSPDSPDPASLDYELTNDYAVLREQIQGIKVTDPLAGTCIQCGLYLANEELNSNPNPYDVSAQKVIILLSDGKSRNLWDGTVDNDVATQHAKDEADRGKDGGIQYYAVGYGDRIPDVGTQLGSAIDENVLKYIASDPDSKYYLYRPDTNNWDDAFKQIYDSVCTQPTPTPIVECAGTCPAEAQSGWAECNYCDADNYSTVECTQREIECRQKAVDLRGLSPSQYPAPIDGTSQPDRIKWFNWGYENVSCGTSCSMGYVCCSPPPESTPTTIPTKAPTVTITPTSIPTEIPSPTPVPDYCYQSASIYLPPLPTPTIEPTSTPNPVSNASLTLTTQDNNIQIGDNIEVKVVLDTDGANTSGTDLVINYDQSSISLVDSLNGTLYDEYLPHDINNDTGHATFSAIASPTSSPFNGIDTFATLTFKALSVGNTTIQVEFTRGVQDDSNVIESETNTDILSKVGDITLSIGDAPTLTSAPTPTTIPTKSPTATSAPVATNTPVQGQWCTTDGTPCTDASYAGTNYVAVYTNNDCSGTTGYRTRTIDPQSSCSTDGSGVCFMVNGTEIEAPMSSQWWYSTDQGDAQTCTPLNPPTSVDFAFDNLEQCYFGSCNVVPIPTTTPFPPTLTPTATPILTPTQTPTPTPGGNSVNMDLAFSIKFQGIRLENIADDTDKTQNVKMTIVKQIADPTTNTGVQTVFTRSFENVQVSTTGEVDENGIAIWDGTLELGLLDPDSNYSIMIKGPKHLQRKFCTDNPSEDAESGLPYRCLGAGEIALEAGQNTLDFSDVLLQAGDLPGPNGQDGILNIHDVSLVINMIRNGQSEDPADLIIADMDLNGVVNAKDRSYLIETLEEKYGDEE